MEVLSSFKSLAKHHRRHARSRTRFVHFTNAGRAVEVEMKPQVERSELCEPGAKRESLQTSPKGDGHQA